MEIANGIGFLVFLALLLSLIGMCLYSYYSELEG